MGNEEVAAQLLEYAATLSGRPTDPAVVVALVAACMSLVSEPQRLLMGRALAGASDGLTPVEQLINSCKKALVN
jgi:hypothetical protein